MDNERLVFEERVSMPPLVHVPASIALVGGLVGLIVATIVTLPSQNPLATVILCASIAICVFACVLVLPGSRVRVDRERLEVSWGPLVRRTIELADVERLEVVHVNAIGDFGGWGPRLSMSFARFGLIARSGPAVEVWSRTRRRSLVLSSGRAEELAAAITARSRTTA